MRYFLLTGNIDRIDLCMTSIEIYLYDIIPYIGRKYFNVLKSTLCIEKLFVSQVIILNKNMMIWKKSLAFVTSTIRHDQVINKTYNAKLLNVKISMIMKA